MAENIFSTLSNVSCPLVELNRGQLVCWSLLISRLMLILRHMILHREKYRIELQEKHIKRSKPLINEEIIHGKIDNRELKTIS